MCVYPPPLWCWERGWGVNILKDVRHSSVLYVCMYFVADNLVWQVMYVRPRNIPAFCADLLEARLVERRPGDHGRQPTREAASKILWHCPFMEDINPGPSPPAFLSIFSRVLQRDVVYLSWPIAPLYVSPNAGGGVSCGVLVQLYTGAQINFGDLTPYLTYAFFPSDPYNRRPLVSPGKTPKGRYFASQLTPPDGWVWHTGSFPLYTT